MSGPRASAISAELGEVRAAEGGAGLLAAAALRRLRDERLFEQLGQRTLLALLGRDVPALDRGSARSLLVIADAFDPASATPERLAVLARLGLARLALLAEAPAEARESLIGSAGQLPVALLRRSFERPPRDTSDPFTTVRRALVERRTPDELREAGEAAVGALARSWREVAAAAWAESRLLARLRDALEGDARALVDAVADHGMDERELTRGLALVDRLGTLSLAERARLGIHALRLLAELPVAAETERIVAELRADESLGADEIIARCRRAGRRQLVAETTSPPAHWVDDPASLVPFNLLYLPDEDEQFADATPAALVEQLLLRASRPGSRVLDLTAGGGTVARVAGALGRSVVELDIISPPLREGVIVGDARSARPAGGPFELVFFHPPLPGEVVYSERYAGRPLAGDISMLTPEGVLAACRDVIANAARLLDDNGRLAIVCREQHFGRRLWDWPALLANAALSVGLVPVDRIHAALGPDARRARRRQHGFRAARDGRTIEAVVSGLIFARAPQRG